MAKLSVPVGLGKMFRDIAEGSGEAARLIPSARGPTSALLPCIVRMARSASSSPRRRGTMPELWASALYQTSTRNKIHLEVDFAAVNYRLSPAGAPE